MNPKQCSEREKKCVHQQRASHSKSKLRQSHYIFLLYNNSLMWQLLFIFFLCVCTVQCSIWFEAARFAYFCSALSSSVCHFCVLAHFLLAERLNCFIAFVEFIPCADISRVFHAIEIYGGKTDILTCMRLIDCCRCCCHFAVAAIAAQRCNWDRALCELSCTGVCVCVR